MDFRVDNLSRLGPDHIWTWSSQFQYIIASLVPLDRSEIVIQMILLPVVVQLRHLVLYIVLVGHLLVVVCALKDFSCPLSQRHLCIFRARTDLSRLSILLRHSGVDLDDLVIFLTKSDLGNHRGVLEGIYLRHPSVTDV